MPIGRPIETIFDASSLFARMRAQEQISKEFRLMWAALVASLVWVASGLYLILR
jgi:hypothetical protein